LHGLCSTHLQREPARHRGLPSRSRSQALSHGDTRGCVPAHSPTPIRSWTGAFTGISHRFSSQGLENSMSTTPSA
jgi:hypothetical protein